MLKDMESLKEAYELVSSEEGIRPLFDKLDGMGDMRPRDKMRNMWSDPLWVRLMGLSEMNIKLVRKGLSGVPYEEIREFNEGLKKVCDDRYVQFFHTKEHWLKCFLDGMVKRKASDRIRDIEAKAGMDWVERSRTKADWRVRDASMGWIGRSYSGFRFVSEDHCDVPGASAKMKCTCIRDFSPEHDGWEIYRKGERYDFREMPDGSKAVYTDPLKYSSTEMCYVFEDGSFEEHFQDREAIIDMILRDDE
jgi:hypothetical protein